MTDLVERAITTASTAIVDADQIALKTLLLQLASTIMREREEAAAEIERLRAERTMRLRRLQALICDVKCPVTWKTSEPQPHCAECADLQRELGALPSAPDKAPRT